MKKYRGLTLVEVVVASVMLFIVAVGGLSYQYLSIKQKRMAWADMAATRTAQMVMEDWKSKGGQILGGSNGYDPSEYDNDFLFQNNTTWKIETENVPMYVTLTSRDEITDESAGITLKKLSVVVRWREDFSDGSVDGDSPSIILESFVRADAEGG